MPCSQPDLSTVVSILRALTPEDLESDPTYGPLLEVAHTLFTRPIKKRLFGEAEVVDFLKTQSENRDLLRRLERVHNLVQQSHLERVEGARSTGINSLREARVHEVNTAAGLTALTTSAGVDTLVHDFITAPAALQDTPMVGGDLKEEEEEEEEEKGVGTKEEGGASLYLSTGTRGTGENAAFPHATYLDFRAGGIGRSRGRKTQFKASKIRGLYDDPAEGGGGEEEEGGGGGVRRTGKIHFLPRPSAAQGLDGPSTLPPSSNPLERHAIHAGQWLCFVTDGENAALRRACAHRTIVELAGKLESRGTPLKLPPALAGRGGVGEEGEVVHPCTYMVGKRKQKWALMGGEVAGLTGETAISVKLCAIGGGGGGGGGGGTSAAASVSTTPLPGGVPGISEAFSPLPGEFSKICNVCKSEYRSLHPFYHQLCPPCGDFNFAKRLATCDLSGYVCVVTGGRVRIGYQIALKLLRAGATVVATSRFTADMSLRFSLEADFADFAPRLSCERLEMTDISAVEAFAGYLIARFPRIHVLINNAAQTITRDRRWVEKMGEVEATSALSLPPTGHTLMDSSWNAQFSPHLLCTHTSSPTPIVSNNNSTALTVVGGGRDAPTTAAATVATTTAAATTTLLSHLTPTPSPTLDESGQPVDTTTENSWSRVLEEVSTHELLTTMAVNSIAPFILCSKLKGVLKPCKGGDERVGHIVNVSSLEGKFNVGKKSSHHPHTNCAKAALNMLTLTSGREYAASGILLNAVDTGWITDMAPLGSGASSKIHEAFVGPPLDEIDGASRVLDPIFVHVNSGGKERMSGLFLKDYHVASW